MGRFVSIPIGADINNLNFQLKLNEEVVQDGNSGNMMFGVNKIIAYVSQYFTLNIGDMIFTGTPAGVGPVNVYDKLEGYLQGERLLEVNIR